MDIIEDLKFISKIGVNEKVSCKYKIIHSNNIFTSISRNLWYKENRNDVIEFLNKLLLRIDNHVKKNINVIELVSFADAITQSIKGINNLISTYNDDKAIVCQYKMIIESLKYVQYDILNKISDIQKPKFNCDIFPKCYIALFEKDKKNNEMIYPIIKSIDSKKNNF